MPTTSGAPRICCPCCGTRQATSDPCDRCESDTIYGAHTRAQLWRAFELVRPREQWKRPIDAVVDPAGLETAGVTVGAIVDAVAFYTGACPFAIRTTTDRKLRIQAAGYYCTVGA